MGDLLGLITLGVGYVVFANASKEKATVKFLGKAIGALIMIASVLTLLCDSMTHCMTKGCPLGGKSCPMMGKAMCNFSK